MPTLTVETHDPEKSILFIVGETNPLIPYLVEKYQKDFKIALVSSKTPATLGEGVFHVNSQNAALIKNLKEKIEYAIVFLQDSKVKDYIGPIFEKFAEDQTKTAIICAIERFEEFYDVANAVKKATSFYFLFEGDVYSEIPHFGISFTAKLIDDAIHKKEVALAGNDLQPIFPIYYKDAIDQITQILLGPAKRKQYYFLFYEHPQTIISAVHIIERIEPDLKITYRESPAERFGDLSMLEAEIEEKLGEKPVFLSQSSDGFENSIKHFITRGPIIEPEEKPSIINAPKKIYKSRKRSFNFISTALLVALLLFVVIEFLSAGASLLLFKDSIVDFQTGKYASAASSAKSANTLLNLVDPAAEIIASTAKKMGNEDITNSYKLFTTAVGMANTASVTSENLTKINDGISNETINQNIADVVWLYFLGQKLKFETKDARLAAYLTPEMANVLTLTQVLPQVLGYYGEKNYLLLFQNNAELRPTGGFIGSVGELKMRNGKIEDLTLQDVYEYDGQLKFKIEPNYVIGRHLQPNLYLRDSNFDPDFQTSASVSAFLYNLETGKKVDGVIAINFDAVKQIIGSIGPIELSTYKKTLTEDNSFDFLQQTIDNNFFPGSTAKKDVLQALFDKIMLKLENPNDATKVARLIPKLMSEKNILFAFNQSSVQSVFSALGYGGDYQDLRSIESGKINDYLAINEANIGVNKANINVTRSTDYTATIAGRKLTSKVTHKINNDGDKGYNTYIRLIIPLGSKLSDIKIDGKTQKIIPAITDPNIYGRKGFIPPTDLEVGEETLNGKTVFGFTTMVNPHSNQIIEMEYENGLAVPNSSLVSYSLLLTKQPGTQPFPFILNLIYGTNYTPREVEDARLENGVIIIDKKVSSDTEITAELLHR